MYIVKEEDLIGDIANFPLEVVQKMILCQIQQGNPADVSVFQNSANANKMEKGFDWLYDEDFWYNVIKERDFELFFKKYPNSKNKLNITYIDETVMEVSDDLETWFRRVVFAIKNEYYLTWGVSESLKEAEAHPTVWVNKWKYARNFKRTITKQQIADWQGCNVNDLLIVD
jgi:hypothetical protein